MGGSLLLNLSCPPHCDGTTCPEHREFRVESSAPPVYFLQDQIGHVLVFLFVLGEVKPVQEGLLHRFFSLLNRLFGSMSDGFFLLRSVLGTLCCRCTASSFEYFPGRGGNGADYLGIDPFRADLLLPNRLQDVGNEPVR